MRPCPFCQRSHAERVLQNPCALAFCEPLPRRPQRWVVGPRRHVSTLFELSAQELQALWTLLVDVRARLQAELKPDGLNVSLCEGSAAGQHIPHAHLEVLPRWMGDRLSEAPSELQTLPSLTIPSLPRPKRLATGGKADPFGAHIQPLIAQADQISILAAFVQDSGLRDLERSLLSALERGAHVRLLTGDYLNITQADALHRLLDWTTAAQATQPPELETLESSSFEASAASPLRPVAESPDLQAARPLRRLEARVIEVATLKDGATSFHPKSWHFESARAGVAFVGSSNVSRAALWSGIEWNLRIDREQDPEAWWAAREAFDQLWRQGTALSRAWVQAYAARVKAHPPLGWPAEVEPEAAAEVFEPTPVQREALTALAASRRAGHRRALVVLATGLGKTWLSAFDVHAFEHSTGSEVRVLFLAHRLELLEQAARTYRRLWPQADFGWLVGEQNDLEGTRVFASVQKLARPEQLARLTPSSFDYVVIDEVHHAAAPSYRHILARLAPQFLLGLTATPDRADEADIHALFDDHVAFHADLGEGIEAGLLTPFCYWGIKDTIEYEHIPWRNRRFDPEALALAVQTQARMTRMWEAWQQHPGHATLVFCCSIPHAHFVAAWLQAQAVRVAVLHSGPGSADRAQALLELAAGRLDAICSVDILNEGVDIPRVDRVIMLRPTESPTLFLQQLGRGLRRAEGKKQLQVIDFVGNHRIFLDRVRTLLALGGRENTLRDVLTGAKSPSLPPGCAVELELEAIALLRRLLPLHSTDRLVRMYRELRAARGRRPTAGELLRLGCNPRLLSRVRQDWLEFVQSEGDLASDETQALAVGRAFFSHIERLDTSRADLLLVLEALVEADALWTGLPLEQLLPTCEGLLARSPELVKAIPASSDGVAQASEAEQSRVPSTPAPDETVPTSAISERVQSLLERWLEERRGFGAWFKVESGMLRSGLPSLEREGAAAFHALTFELLEYRLAEARSQSRALRQGQGFTAQVLLHLREPALKLPSRTAYPDLPSDYVEVRREDGTHWQFRFQKEYCDVARPVGSDRNQLPDLLRSWFGPYAGQPNTSMQVRFYRSPDGWWVRPEGGQAVEQPARGHVVTFPSLRAAAGAQGSARLGEPDASTVALPIQGAASVQVFAVRVSGHSMAGGHQPLRDGDWVLMQWARSRALGGIEGRVALVAIGDPQEGQSYHLKRVARREGQFWLDSDNPVVPSFQAPDDAVVIAVQVGHIPPESLAPPVGTRLSDDALMQGFGISARPHAPFRRVDGHLFILLDTPESFERPDAFRLPVSRLGAGETAYVLTRAPKQPEAPWRYAGVARQQDGLWTLPELDFETWRALGSGRSASRTLEPSWEQAARALIAQLMHQPGPGSWLELEGRRCRLVAQAAKGGLRIDGGPDGFQERTISLRDLGWVLKAAEEARRMGATLDEAWVNRLRYLEGTPKGATRWIDTGHALLLVCARP